MLGLLLACAGVDVLVLEKHADFMRDFRGDTIHPSTARLMDELGLGAPFQALPLRHNDTVRLVTDDGPHVVADFRRIPGRHTVGFLPQWDFLDLVRRHAEHHPTFALRRRTEVTGVLDDGRRVTGVRARSADGRHLEVLADLVVACDGRDSVVLLRVQLNRLRRWWRPGLLCIGDAAHAMSPVGGVGINLAVQDAVATARITADPLRRGALSTAHLARVQLRRMLPTVVTQLGQPVVHDRVLDPLVRGRGGAGTPALIRLLDRYPPLRAVPAWVIGRGVLPEHAPSAHR